MLPEPMDAPSGIRPQPKPKSITSFLVSLFIVCLLFLGLYHFTPPAAAPADAPVEEFSSGRAIKDLQVVAQKPHPIGSDENGRVRQFVLARLQELGSTPEVQQTTGVFGQRLTAGTVQNVLARLKGTDNSKAVLLVSHYDSVPTGPGASDDGAAVVAMIETLRALKNGPPLRNDVIFLFTDGEESGLLGAAAFVNEHPWAADVGVACNFEARGSRGPSVMFETSSNNGWLIKEYAKAVPHPLGNSLMYEFYKMLPNDTDMTVLKKAGLAGLNFAYIGGHTQYHTLLDNLETIDERSLQHHGSYMLALTRRFGNENLNATAAPDMIFFDIPGSTLIYYPVSWVIPLTIIAGLLYLSVAALAFRRRQLRLGGLALGFLVFLLSLIVASVIISLLWYGVLTIHSGYRWIPQGDTYNSHYYLISFVALTVAITSALFALCGRRIGISNLTFGALLWWLLLLIVVSVVTPGGSYLFLWPLLSSLIALGYIYLFAGADFGREKSCIALCLGAIPGLILLPAFIHLLFVGLTPRMSGAVMIPVVLLLGTLIPLLAVLSHPKSWLVPGGSLLLGVVFLLVGSFTSGFDKGHRKPNSIFYALDADTGKAAWVTADPALDEWTKQFFTAGVERGTLPVFLRTPTQQVLKSPAPAIPLAPPSVQVLEDATNNGVRNLHLRITSSRGGTFMTVSVDEMAALRRATINGEVISQGESLRDTQAASEWKLRYAAPPKQGIDLIFEITSSSPLKIVVVDRSYELPVVPGFAVQPRPDFMMPAPLWGSDSTMVAKSFTF
jgi:hypothetical protein